ncbi:hypothetical protein SESBI_05928 [Sesbania bispinosa]|nr:hypothetical protein SESBI_05928 [Sesbania bispinosa]
MSTVLQPQCLISICLFSIYTYHNEQVRNSGIVCLQAFLSEREPPSKKLRKEEKRMGDPAIASLIASWFTPSSLFIFVNLVIGTIAITSRFATPKTQPQLRRSPSLLQRVSSFTLRNNYNHYEPTFVTQPDSECTQPQLVRTPSFLERVRSFNLSLYKHEPAAHTETEYALQPEPENPKEPQLVRTPSLLQRVRSMSFSRLYTSDSIHTEHEDPDPNPCNNEEKSKAEMKKSASERGGSMNCEWEEDEETVERRRPATATARSETREDEEVDAKADDFINRFKKQLRLQRIDSLLRYREILRGN